MSLIATDPAAAAPAPVADLGAALAVEAPAVAAVAPVADTPVVAEAVAPVRPEGVPDALWDATTGLKTTEALARLTELETADAARREGVPADAAGYKLELATPINDPTTGKPIAFNAEDPLAKGALAWAHENGVPQAALSNLLGVFAQNEMANLAAHNAAVAAETAKLGDNGAARITAVSSALAKHAGVDGAKAIMANLGTAQAVIGLEAVLKSLAGPAIGGAPPNNAKAALADLSGVELLSAVLK